ncbi:hypothetical protein [Glaciecola sp. 33A]|uniref:hypothetical protein n=1 Tax=Glaciecola sp. 33A TaxID=2057807 RepID=UPI000C32CBCB|nr:hypothetical protein [Glaciecola sp. 33A]PKI00277.1 hypothetical protein CXF81_19210 [Glaciecola sp. 33A]
MRKSIKICNLIVKGKIFIILVLFLSKLSYGADHEIDISIEQVSFAGNNAIFEIVSASPVFIGKDIKSVGEIVFNTSVKMHAAFQPINQFRIRVNLNKDEFSYLKSFDTVKVIYPHWLVSSTKGRTIYYISYKELGEYDKYLLEKASYTEESQRMLYGDAITEKDLEGTKLRFVKYFSNLDVKNLVSKAEN